MLHPSLFVEDRKLIETQIHVEETGKTAGAEEDRESGWECGGG